MRHLHRSVLLLLLSSCRPAAPEPTPEPAPAPVAEARAPGGQNGASRWKDTAVYVDGQPVGMLAFGELPIALAPVWIEDEVSVPVKPGERGPASRREKQRQYRFTDYLRAVGVDPRQVKELHVYGPKRSEILAVSGQELQRRGDELRFRFGGEVHGKAIPVVPGGMGNGRSPDKISAVMVYVARTPPTLVRNVGPVLDGVPVAGVAYAGEPVRGGVHIYVDDRLASVLKRKRLTAEGTTSRRPLLALLETQGIETRGLAELWIIRGERRRERLTRDQLAVATVELGAAARLVIHLGETAMPVGALAFHSRPLQPGELPQILPDEE